MVAMLPARAILFAVTGIAAVSILGNFGWRFDGKKEDETSSDSSSTSSKTPRSHGKSMKKLKSHPLPATVSKRCKEITLVHATSLAQSSGAHASLWNQNRANLVYRCLSGFFPNPGPVLDSWALVLLGRSEILRIAAAMLSELEALSLFSASLYLPEEAVFPAGATLAFIRALLARYPILNCPDVAAALYKLECYVRRAYISRSVVAAAAPLLLAGPSSALVPYGKTSRALTRKKHLSLENATSAGPATVADDDEATPFASPPSSTRYTPTSPKYTSFSPEYTLSSPSFFSSEGPSSSSEESTSIRFLHLQLLLRSNINYWCFEVAKRMGFAGLASNCVQQSANDVTPVVLDVINRCSPLELEDQMMVMDFSLLVAGAQQEWTVSDERNTLTFVADEESLVNSVSFILNLSAGALPRNKKTLKLLDESCMVISDFLGDYLDSLESLSLEGVTPKGIMPFNVVEDFVVDAVDNIQLADPRWFDIEKLAISVQALKEKVAEVGAALDREIVKPQVPQFQAQQEDLPHPMTQEEADIANFMAAVVGASHASDDDDHDSAPGAGPSAAGFEFTAETSTTAPSTSNPADGVSTEGAAPAFNFTAPAFGAPNSGFVFGAGAAEASFAAAPGASAADTLFFDASKFGAIGSGFAFGNGNSGSATSPADTDAPAAADPDDFPPAINFNASTYGATESSFVFGSGAATFQADRQDSGSSSGESTPLSQSGSVFGFGPAEFGASDDGKGGKPTRAGKAKGRKKK